jgi:hypothetical protein
MAIPRRTASSGKVQKYAMKAAANRYWPMMSYVSRRMVGPPVSMIGHPLLSSQG